MICGCDNKSLELKIKKGESLGFAFSLYQSGQPQNLTDTSIVLEVRENPIDNGEYVFTKTITTATNPEINGIITNPTQGQFFFKINSADTENMSTLKPYFMAIYTVKDSVRHCISAPSNKIAKFIVLNP